MKTDMELRQEISHAEKVVRHLRKQLRERKRKAHGLGPRKKGMGVRIGDRDDDLKAARGYTDPSSYVRRDGSEKLVGEDWTRRVMELAVRSGGTCEKQWTEPCTHNTNWTHFLMRCDSPARDPHHVIKRSLRRDDRLSNLLHLCGPHHEDLDPRKIRSGKVGA